MNSFDLRTKKKGEQYFRQGAVKSLGCEAAGANFSATVSGGEMYQVLLSHNDKWESRCSCPMESDCKHAYAAFKQLLIEHTNAAVQTSAGV